MKSAPVWIATICLVAAGFVYGDWVDRWGFAPALAASKVDLPKLPLELGDWKGEDAVLTDDQKKQMVQAEAVSYLVRRYVNQQNGDQISLMILCGHPGPMTTHTPEVCFTGAGFDMLGSPMRYVPPQPGKATFWVADFRKRSSVITDAGLRVFWAWSPDGTWSVAADPRVTFARHRALYKVYVTCEKLMEGPPRDDEPGARFLQVLLPALNRTVFPK
jgi:hypothetical protein